MFWTDLHSDSQLLERIFINPPVIGEISVLCIEIDSDFGEIMIYCELPNILPDNPPLKWGSFNSFSIGLQCLNVKCISKLMLLNPDIGMTAKLTINFISENQKEVSIIGAFCDIKIICNYVGTSKPSVYTKVP